MAETLKEGLQKLHDICKGNQNCKTCPLNSEVSTCFAGMPPVAWTDKEIGKIIEAAQALEQEPRWIPVSEKLPKAGEYVGNVAKYYLVQNEYGDMLVARYTHSECWEQMYHFKPIGDEIVAWMPLPKPYEQQKEVEFHCGFEESGFHAYNCNDCPNKCEEWHQWDKEMKGEEDE